MCLRTTHVGDAIDAPVLIGRLPLVCRVELLVFCTEASLPFLASIAFVYYCGGSFIHVVPVKFPFQAVSGPNTPGMRE